MNVALDSPIRYILEVNLEYPQDLYNAHTDLLFCPRFSSLPSPRYRNREYSISTERTLEYSEPSPRYWDRAYSIFAESTRFSRRTADYCTGSRCTNQATETDSAV